MSRLAPRKTTIGALYLARGVDNDALTKFQAFRNSYCRWQAGVDHQLYVIFKGFKNAVGLELARAVFREVAHRAIYVDDDAFDLGAYLVAASRVDQENVCFLNTASEIRGSNWLLKLAVNLERPDVGMVSCTASYEAPQHPGKQNVPFPNPHLRSNAFMMRRDRFLAMRPDAPLTDKIDAHLFEHGPEGISRRVWSQGLRTLLVGKNGRGYDPAWWPRSRTFRQGTQSNLLVADNQTKSFEKASHAEKRFLFHLAWGDGAIGQVDSPIRTRRNQLGITHADDPTSAEAIDDQSTVIKPGSLSHH